MADTKITDLAEDTAPATTDYLVTVDRSDTSMASSGTDKKVQVGNLPISTAAATALAAKASDSTVVHLTGNETIAGTKTFSSPIVGSITGNAATATTAAGLSAAIPESSVTGLVADLATLAGGISANASAVAARLVAASNLSDLVNAATARTNLGLGTAAVAASSSFAAATHTHTTSQITDLATWAGSTAITTLGTIATGTWHGSPIGVAYLGTGTPAAGKYLDGAGAWTTLPAGGGGGGSPGGAAGSIQYYASGAFAGVSTFKYDSTNGRLGIGTATPVSLLDIQGPTSLGQSLGDKLDILNIKAIDDNVDQFVVSLNRWQAGGDWGKAEFIVGRVVDGTALGKFGFRSNYVYIGDPSQFDAITGNTEAMRVGGGIRLPSASTSNPQITGGDYGESYIAFGYDRYSQGGIPGGALTLRTQDGDMTFGCYNANGFRFYTSRISEVCYIGGNGQLDVTPRGGSYALNVKNSSGGATLGAIRADASFAPPHLADSAAANDSLFYSTTVSKLAYKDPGGTVHYLY